MNIKELKEAIKDLPDDMSVFIQKDEEGNGYKELAGIDPDVIIIDDGDIEVYAASWSAYDADKDEDEWQEILSNKRSLVLYP